MNPPISKSKLRLLLIGVVVFVPFQDSLASLCSSGIKLASKVPDTASYIRRLWKVDTAELSDQELDNALARAFLPSLEYPYLPDNAPTPAATYPDQVTRLLDRKFQELVQKHLDNKREDSKINYPAESLAIEELVLKDDIKKNFATDLGNGAIFDKRGRELTDADDFFKNPDPSEQVNIAINPLIYAVDKDHKIYLIPQQYGGVENKHPHILGGSFYFDGTKDTVVWAAGLIEFDGKEIVGFSFPNQGDVGLQSGHFRPDREMALHTCLALVKHYWRFLNRDLKIRLVRANSANDLIEIITDKK